MEHIDLELNSIKILVCRDIDTLSCLRLAEKYVPLSPLFDAVLLFGPFIHVPTTTDEERAIAESDMASMIAQLENIVCRVVYLPASDEPTNCLTEQMHLTPNSVAIHSRRINLATNLYLMGFSENDNGSLVDSKTVDIGDDDCDEKLDNVVVQSAESAVMIQEMLDSQNQNAGNFGIFALNYVNSHTLNKFLFHMPLHLENSGVELCIISSDSEEYNRIPEKFGRLNIVTLKSLRIGGYYTVVDLVRTDATDRWRVASTTTASLAD